MDSGHVLPGPWVTSQLSRNGQGAQQLGQREELTPGLQAEGSQWGVRARRPEGRSPAALEGWGAPWPCGHGRRWAGVCCALGVEKVGPGQGRGVSELGECPWSTQSWEGQGRGAALVPWGCRSHAPPGAGLSGKCVSIWRRSPGPGPHALPDSPRPSSLLLLRAQGLVLMGLSPPRRDTRRIEAGCALATSSYLKCTCKDPISTRSYWGAGLEHVLGTELHPQQGP